MLLALVAARAPALLPDGLRVLVLALDSAHGGSKFSRHLLLQAAGPRAEHLCQHPRRYPRCYPYLNPTGRWHTSACAGITSRGGRCSRRRGSCHGSTVSRAAAGAARLHGLLTAWRAGVPRSCGGSGVRREAAASRQEGQVP